MNKAWIGLILVIVLLLAARIGVGLMSHKSDREQIRDALQESIQAGKDGRAGGVLELLSNQLTVNNESAAGGMSQLADFIKKSHPDVTFDHIDPVITGDHAQVDSPASIDVNFLGQHRTIHLDDVLMIFQKEPATEWYIIPTHKWRLEQVQAPNFSPGQLAG